MKDTNAIAIRTGHGHGHKSGHKSGFHKSSGHKGGKGFHDKKGFKSGKKGGFGKKGSKVGLLIKKKVQRLVCWLIQRTRSIESIYLLLSSNSNLTEIRFNLYTKRVPRLVTGMLIKKRFKGWWTQWTCSIERIYLLLFAIVNHIEICFENVFLSDHWFLCKSHWNSKTFFYPIIGFFAGILWQRQEALQRRPPQERQARPSQEWEAWRQGPQKRKEGIPR